MVELFLCFCIQFHRMFASFGSRLTIFDDVFAEEDPTSTKQGSESEQKTNEKPNSSSANAEASVSERFPTKLTVRNSIDPEKKSSYITLLSGDLK